MNGTVRFTYAMILVVVLTACAMPTPLTPIISHTATPRLADTPTEIPTPTLGIGSTLTREKDGMAMVYVPAGEFLMGGNADDAVAECQNYSSSCTRSWFTNEEPIHQVYLDAFWIDKTEVTKAMYILCVDEGVCEPPGGDFTFRKEEYANHPVFWVDWHQAKAYCAWAGADLPSEAQWEKAARGTEGRMYPWGEGIDCTKANYLTCNTTRMTTVAGSYPDGASPYGALDMSGNAWEWVNDWYGETYYGQLPDANPQGPSSGEYRVLRSGAWDYNAHYIRSSYRFKQLPDIRYGYVLGFRCSRSQ